MGDARVSIVIPNYNGEQLLRRNLPPLMAELSGRDAEVIVADGGSGDGSVTLLRNEFPRVAILASDRPLAFAANCSRAVARARGEIVVCLNTDVRVIPGFLGPLLELFDQERTFAVSPRIMRPTAGQETLINESLHRSFYSFGLVYHSGLSEVAGAVGSPADISFACGAAFAFRRDVFLRLGGFDPLYAPFYWEDFDLCYRAWKRGWTVRYQPASVVIHEHRATIGRFYSRDDIDTILETNRFLFVWKNITDPLLTAGHFVFLPAKLLEAAGQRRWYVWKAFRQARRKFGDAWAAREIERREQTVTDREVLRIYRQSARHLLSGAGRSSPELPAG
jgi:GT2 family glycosyltransferase